MSLPDQSTLSPMDVAPTPTPPPPWSERLLKVRQHWGIPLLIAAHAAIPLVFLVDMIAGPGITLAALYLLPLIVITLTSRSTWHPYLVALGLTLLVYVSYRTYPADLMRYGAAAGAWRALAQLSTYGALVLVTQCLLWTTLRLRVYAQALDAERARAWTLATTDALTGLANHRHFDERMAAELRRGGRTGQPLAVLMLDLDHFKEINDRWGHAAGDRALCHVADVLRLVLRASDLPARLGGDEFAVLLPETGEEQARIVRQKLQDELTAAHASDNGTAPPHPLASVGMAISMPPQGLEHDATVEDAAALLARADQALYQVKEAHHAVTTAEALLSR